jgi:hypothetical protein
MTDTDVCIYVDEEDEEDGDDIGVTHPLDVGISAYMTSEQMKRMRSQGYASGHTELEFAELKKRKHSSDGECDDFMLGCIGDDDLGTMPSMPLESQGDEKKKKKKKKQDMANLQKDDGLSKAEDLLKSCLEDPLSDELSDQLICDDEEDDVALPSKQMEVAQKIVQDAGSMVELKIVDNKNREFEIIAMFDSTLDFPCMKFEEHAKKEGWVEDAETIYFKYIFDGVTIDPKLNTPADFDMEDGDIIEVYYKSNQ